MSSDKDKTILENLNTYNNVKTILENEATVRDNGAEDNQKYINPQSNFRGMKIIRQLITGGSEADLFLVAFENQERILKLYRLGLDPKPEVLDRYLQISQDYPQHIVKVFEAGLDDGTGRWFELLEYMPNGSVADILNKESAAVFDFNEFVRELSAGVGALHECGIVHRDLKPGNILVRSIHPLDLVLSDFGIASLLESGASVRETQHKGFTPMYAAPEDILGYIVSRPVDWWACGMIFYEILAGKHPFMGISQNRINYFLSTYGVEVDENLPDHEKLLLKGLLTRNDKKRWGLKEVNAWLAGSKNIPCYYEIKTASPMGMENVPFTFLGNKYENLHDLAVGFASNYESWQATRGSLARGNVAKWLQNRNQFDEERIVAEELANDNPDIYLFRFIEKFAPDLPFNLLGMQITAKNLLDWFSRPKESRSDGQQKIIELVLNKEIYKYVSLSTKLDAQLNEVLDFIKEDSVNEEQISRIFLALVRPDILYWGPFGQPQNSHERMEFALKNSNMLSYKMWEEMRGPEMILPPQIYALFKSGAYEEAIINIVNRKEKGEILFLSDKISNISQDNVYTGSDEDYTLEIGIKNGLGKNSLKIMEKTLHTINKIRYSSGIITFPLLKTYIDVINGTIEDFNNGKKPWKDEYKEIFKNITKDINKLRYLPYERFDKYCHSLWFISLVLLIIASICIGSYYYGEIIIDSIVSYIDNNAINITMIGALFLFIIFTLLFTSPGVGCLSCCFFGFLIYLIVNNQKFMFYGTATFIITFILIVAYIVCSSFKKSKIKQFEDERSKLIVRIPYYIKQLYKDK